MRRVVMLVLVVVAPVSLISLVALAQDDFQQQLGEIMRKAKPSIKPENLGQHGMALTQACNQGDLQACKGMENYGQQWCTGRGDCTYLVELYQKECSLGDSRACADASKMHQQAGEAYQHRWGGH
jgi:hypothetical protein